MEFKDYKEKQKYYKEKAKQSKMIWESSNGKNNGIVKGRTYVKPKGDKK
jgi:hypothetical protein